MTFRKIHFSGTEPIQKHGITLTEFGEDILAGNASIVTTTRGHFEEFLDKESTYTYLIVEGKGVFFLDDQSVDVCPGDMLVVDPKTRIHYFGNLKMVLIVSPTWKEGNEVHIRDIQLSESPYQ